MNIIDEADLVLGMCCNVPYDVPSTHVEKFVYNIIFIRLYHYFVSQPVILT